ncbi:hypothetical protein CF326_g899 [Tilletia indica]|nr:hypothetical protein CF326_g899 [Tilletia indica]
MSSTPTSILMKRKAESDAADVNRPAPAERANQSAKKVWDNSEIVLEILSYLVRERIDLLVISRVSKSLRVLALQLLVRHLDVPLTNAPACVHFFEANPNFCNSIKFVRVWDDEAVRQIELGPGASTQPPKYRTFTQRLPTYDSVQERDLRWFGFDRLLRVLQAHRTTQPLPLIDVTIGITGVSVFKATTRRFPKLLQRISALRVIYDQEEEPDLDNDSERMQQLAQLATIRWRQLGLMIADMFHTGGQLPALRLFHAEDGIYWSPKEWHTDQESWDLLKNVLPTTVEDLAIKLSWDEADLKRTCTLLETDWPLLRTFSLRSEIFETPNLNRIQQVIDQFLTRHQHLEDISIYAFFDFDSIPIPQNFPKLKKCAIDKSNYADLAPFLARHYGTVTDLAIPELVIRERDPTLFPPDISTNLEPDSLKLEVLRASPEVAATFVSKGARPRHYEMEDARSVQELKFDQWLFPVSEAAEAVTCLNVSVTTSLLEDLTGEAVLQAEFLWSGALPNLVELALRWAISGTSDRADDGRELVCETLAILKHQMFLRALRLEHPHAALLPPDTVLDLEWDDAMPPRLEYLTWHSSSINVSQYFRVGRISTVQPEILSDGSHGRGSVGSVRKVRLERLPDMFRSRIDDSGVWHQSWRPRARETLFDHSHSPPRLHT